MRIVRITTIIQHLQDDGKIATGDQIAHSWIDVPEGDYVSTPVAKLVQTVAAPQFTNTAQIFSHGKHDERARDIAELEKMNG